MSERNLKWGMLPLYRGWPDGAGLVTVTYQWSNEYGECYDCGNPAAFYIPAYYQLEAGDGDDAKGTPIGKRTKLCAVCAANHAADGDSIERINPEI